MPARYIRATRFSPALAICLALCSTSYAGSPGETTSCAACHRAETKSLHRNAMAGAIQLPPDQDILKRHPRLTFEKDGYAYTIERKGGQSIYTVSDARGQLSLPIQYAFGVHSQTFVFLYQGEFYESMVSYYALLSGLASTLGSEKLMPGNLVEALGRRMSPAEAIACFECHSTGGVTAGKLTLDTLKPGVDCEHCHEGATAHMQAISQGKTAPPPARLGQLAAEDMSDFCGKCHRTWEYVVRKREWGTGNVRFSAYRLANSQCFLGDDNRIRCTACHDPHGDLAGDKTGYDHACLACHASPPRKPCTVSKHNCVSCHMPKVTLADGHELFTDHQIRIVRPGDAYPN